MHKVVIAPKAAYIYHELASSDEIRVLRIMPGRSDDEIQCCLVPSLMPSSQEMHSTSMTETLQYDALSYRWGRGDPRIKIMLHSYGRYPDLNTGSGPSISG